MLKTKVLLPIVFLTCYSFQIFSQPIETSERKKYIKIHTGLMTDSYNSAGPRLYFEYLSEFKERPKWSWGISMENKWHAVELISDLYAPPNVNSNIVSFKVHYQVNLIKQNVFWDVNLGAGFIHLFWDENHTLQPSVNIGITLNVKLSPNVYLETAPLLILLPVSDIYFSTSRAYKAHTGYAQFTILPIGIKIKI